MGRLIRNSALLFILVIFTGFFIFWANQVELDEMTRIQGVVMPSSKEKVIQSEFNGRLTEIRVKLGDRLAAGDLIARVSDEEMLADRESVREDLLRSSGSIHRIESMQTMEIPSFSSAFVKEVLQGRADIALEQVEIARTALAAYREEMTLIQNQRDQIRQRISDALSELRSIEDAVRLVREEQNIIAPMVEKGYEPRLRLIQIRQKLQDAEAKENKLKNQVSLLELSYDELDTKLNKLLSDFQANLAVEYANATASLKKAEVELSKVDRRLRAAAGSPVAGREQAGPGPLLPGADSRANARARRPDRRAGEGLYRPYETDEHGCVRRREGRPADQGAGARRGHSCRDAGPSSGPSGRAQGAARSHPVRHSG